jgi:epoxyqueuosine reductase
VRNVLIAAGNAKDARLVPRVLALLSDPAPIVRGAAVWALARLADGEVWKIAKEQRMALETEADVRDEWMQETGT